MRKTTFKIAKMDCPSEEQMIRMKLGDLKNIKSLKFDIPARRLDVIHEGGEREIFRQLETLKYGASIESSEPAGDFVEDEDQNAERKTLRIVLFINFSFFAFEFITGFFSNSMGLIADSLDMLADSLVYGLALFAVGGTAVLKKRIALFAGGFQIILAALGFAEVVRRFAGMEKMPDPLTMVAVSALALAANAVCLYLLQKNKSGEAHIRASVIFTSNDIIINSGVIAAGLLVFLLDSSYPDLIIGAIVFLIVARGAYRILRLSR